MRLHERPSVVEQDRPLRSDQPANDGDGARAGRERHAVHAGRLPPPRSIRCRSIARRRRLVGCATTMAGFGEAISVGGAAPNMRARIATSWRRRRSAAARGRAGGGGGVTPRPIAGRRRAGRRRQCQPVARLSPRAAATRLVRREGAFAGRAEAASSPTVSAVDSPAHRALRCALVARLAPRTASAPRWPGQAGRVSRVADGAAPAEAGACGDTTSSLALRHRSRRRDHAPGTFTHRPARRPRSTVSAERRAGAGARHLADRAGLKWRCAPPCARAATSA